MYTNTQQSYKQEDKREIESIVNYFIEEFNQQLLDYFQKTSKMPECEHQSHRYNYQKYQETNTQLAANEDSTNGNTSDLNKIQDQFRSQKLRLITQNDNQPIYSADFQTYHSLEGEQGHKKQNAQNLPNKITNQVNRKSEANYQEADKITEKAKKNIRVHNKSSPNINKFSQINQNRYNELRDKTLVQYFYPKQKKIFRDNLNKYESYQTKFIDNGKTAQVRQLKLIKQSQSERNENMAFWLKMNKQSSYKTKNDCGRKIIFDTYDLISCNFSMRQYRFVRPQNMKQIQKRENENREPDQSVLQHRIKNMQEKVYKKMPFLVQMGVKFKIAREKF